jgi:hypothetical protein
VKNPAITLNHPSDTKEFKWIKHWVPTLDSLSGPMASPKKQWLTSGAANAGPGCGGGGSCLVTPAASTDTTPNLPTTLPIEEVDPIFPVEVVWKAPNLGGIPADSPGSGTRKYIQSPTGNVMGSVMSQLSLMRTRSSSRQSPPISPAWKHPTSSVHSLATGSVVVSDSCCPPMSVLRALPATIPAGEGNANTSADDASNAGPKPAKHRRSSHDHGAVPHSLDLSAHPHGPQRPHPTQSRCPLEHVPNLDRPWPYPDELSGSKHLPNHLWYDQPLGQFPKVVMCASKGSTSLVVDQQWSFLHFHHFMFLFNSVCIKGLTSLVVVKTKPPHS